MKGIEGAIECLNAGDALMFVDAIMHGSPGQVNPGQRRRAVFATARAGGCLRYPFKNSDAMLARLSPERRTILEPQPQSLAPPGAAA